MISKYIKDPNVLCVYHVGSQVYGTATPESDTDLIVVAKEWFDSENIDVHVYTVDQFQAALDRHDIQAMECICSRQDFFLKEDHVFEMPEINLAELRKSISTICNNSWVKGKKKLIVAGDYDLNLAIKSIFHSLRIYDYGFQIATTGKIHNFQSMNYILKELKLLSTRYQRDELWEKIDNRYRKIYKQKASDFKRMAPKDLTESNKAVMLDKVLKKKFGKIDKELRDEILFVFQN